MILGFLKLQQKWSYEDKGEVTFQVCPGEHCGLQGQQGQECRSLE